MNRRIAFAVWILLVMCVPVFAGFGDTWDFGVWQKGAALEDPDADKVPQWDDSENKWVWIDPGAGGGGTDELVKVDAAATAGYLGATGSAGVLRIGTGLSYTDGGDFVTIANTVTDTDTDELVKVDAAATADYLGATGSAGVLRIGTGLSYTDGGDFITLANTVTDTDTDELVGVDSAATPDYVGNSSSTGFLRTGSNITYADGGDFVTLSVGPDLTAIDSITITEDGWVGIGSGSEKISFDGTGGAVTVDGANLGIGNTPTQALEVFNGADSWQIYSDASISYLRASNATVQLKTSTADTITRLEVRGNGDGHGGQLRFMDQDDAEWLQLDISDGIAALNIYGASPGPLSLYSTASNDVSLFGGAAEGETPDLRIAGWRTGAAARRIAYASNGYSADNHLTWYGVTGYEFDGNVGIGVVPSQKFEVGSADNTDRISIYHDNTDAFLAWDDGTMHLSTDEGTNTITAVKVRGKGTGNGTLYVDDEDNAESLYLAATGGEGYVRMVGSSPSDLHLQNTAHADLRIFTHATEGETPEMVVSGYRTGDSLRQLEIGVGTDDDDTASFDGVSTYFFDGTVLSDVAVDVNSTTPFVYLSENDQTTTNRVWGIESRNSNFTVSARTDDKGSYADAFSIARSGTQPGLFTIGRGELALGTDGSYRGALTLWDNSTGAGYLKMHSDDGTASYLFAGDNGALRIHTAAPTADTDGYEPGYHARSDIASHDWTEVTLTADGTWRDLDCTSIVGSNAKAIAFVARIEYTSAGFSFGLRTNGYTNGINQFSQLVQVANIGNYMYWVVACDSGEVVEYRLSNVTWTSVDLSVVGWWN